MPTDFASLSSFSLNQSNQPNNIQSNQQSNQIIGLPSNIQIFNQSTANPNLVNITQTRTETLTPINYPTQTIQQPLTSTSIQTPTVSRTQTFSPINQTQIQPQTQTQPILVFQNLQQQNQNQQQIQQNQYQYENQQQQQLTSVAPDPFCASFNPNGSCIRCSQRYYFNSNGVCIQVSANCNQYNATTGVCTSCYQSYTLYNG